MRIITYNFYKEIDGMKVYKNLMENKYNLEFREDGKIVCIHFYFDDNGKLIIDNVYKNMTNYKSHRYIKKYTENETLINAMMEIKKELIDMRLLMNEHKIKGMLNKEIINRMCDGSAANVLKAILFNDNNKIDWNEAYKIMIAFMPELKLYDGYKEENMK